MKITKRAERVLKQLEIGRETFDMSEHKHCIIGEVRRLDANRKFAGKYNSDVAGKWLGLDRSTQRKFFDLTICGYGLLRRMESLGKVTGVAGSKRAAKAFRKLFDPEVK